MNQENLVRGALVSGSGNFWLTLSHAFHSDWVLTCCFTFVGLSRPPAAGCMLAEGRSWPNMKPAATWSEQTWATSESLNWVSTVHSAWGTGFTVSSNDAWECFLVLVFVFTPSYLEKCTSRLKKLLSGVQHLVKWLLAFFKGSPNSTKKQVVMC